MAISSYTRSCIHFMEFQSIRCMNKSIIIESSKEDGLNLFQAQEIFVGITTQVVQMLKHSLEY